MAVATPHFAHPFRVVGKAVAVVEQDSQHEIDKCIEAVLRTPIGTRIEAPEYGAPDETFAQLSADQGAEAFVVAIEEWEPRARVQGQAAIEGLVKRVTIESEGAA